MGKQLARRLAPAMVACSRVINSVHLTWTENNGPAVRAPDKRSFGTRLIETLGRQLKGEVRLTYEPSGFVYALDVPLASLTSMASE